MSSVPLSFFSLITSSHPNCNTYTSLLQSSEDSLADNVVTINSLMDQILNLMHIPCFLQEANLIYRKLKEEGRSTWESKETLFQGLLLLGSAAEIIVCFSARKWVVFSSFTTDMLTTICYISRIILYERAIFYESQMLYKFKKFQEIHPHIDFKKDREYLHAYFQFVSHITLLTWNTLRLVDHIKKTPYSPTLLRILQITNLYFGWISMQYEDEVIFPLFFEKYFPRVNLNIYD